MDTLDGIYYALLIGNRDYQHLPPLETPFSDIEQIGTLLQERYGFEVTFLRNTTRAQIYAALFDFGRRMGPNDSFLLYYARHVLVVADSCFSGSIARGQSDGKQCIAVSRQRLAARKSRNVLASGSLEPVVDGQGGGLSAFARAFLATLGDSHDDFSMGEAFPEIQEMVARNSDQTPVYSYIRNTGDELRDFVFRPTIDEPATR